MQPVLINGINYSWNNLTWILFGIPLVGITEIEFSRKREKTNNYGLGSEPTSRGYKNYIYTGSVSVYRDEIRAIERTAPNFSILDVPMHTATLMYSGDGVDYATTKIFNIEYTEDNCSSKQNDSMIVVKLPFISAGLEHS